MLSEHEYPDFWKSICLMTQYKKTAFVINFLLQSSLPAVLMLDTRLQILDTEELTFSPFVFVHTFLNILILVFFYILTFTFILSSFN